MTSEETIELALRRTAVTYSTHTLVLTEMLLAIADEIARIVKERKGLPPFVPAKPKGGGGNNSPVRQLDVPQGISGDPPKRKRRTREEMCPHGHQDSDDCPECRH
jgi:hypothetical protein